MRTPSLSLLAKQKEERLAGMAKIGIPSWHVRRRLATPGPAGVATDRCPPRRAEREEPGAGLPALPHGLQAQRPVLRPVLHLPLLPRRGPGPQDRPVPPPAS